MGAGRTAVELLRARGAPPSRPETVADLAFGTAHYTQDLVFLDPIRAQTALEAAA